MSSHSAKKQAEEDGGSQPTRRVGSRGSSPRSAKRPAQSQRTPPHQKSNSVDSVQASDRDCWPKSCETHLHIPRERHPLRQVVVVRNSTQVPDLAMGSKIKFMRAALLKVEQNLVESTQNASARNRKRQPKDLETSRLESARSLHTELTHSRAKETAETACNT
jgi:hypothetical protein